MYTRHSKIDKGINEIHGTYGERERYGVSEIKVIGQVWWCPSFIFSLWWPVTDAMNAKLARDNQRSPASHGVVVDRRAAAAAAAAAANSNASEGGGGGKDLR